MKKNIKRTLRKSKFAHVIYTPQLLNVRVQKDKNTFNKLLQTAGIQCVDNLDAQRAELNEINSLSSSSGNARQEPDSLSIDSRWVYFPWKNHLVHILAEEDFKKVRISRNRNLIMTSEQKLFEEARIGFAGLNVGNPGALCIVLEGGARRMKFADYDTLSLSNLNRFRAGLCELGLNKATLSARQAYEINPYIDITVFEKGIQERDIDTFLIHPRINLLIEEMDNLPLKVSIRERARKHGIPVLMVTGSGEDIIIDIERYDVDSSLPILNGHLAHEVVQRVRTKNTSIKERILLARDFMGAQYLTKRLRDSFLEVGKTIPAIPQIAESSFLRGAALCYFARQIVIGSKNVRSGRYVLKMSDIIA